MYPWHIEPDSFGLWAGVVVGFGGLLGAPQVILPDLVTLDEPVLRGGGGDASEGCGCVDTNVSNVVGLANDGDSVAIDVEADSKECGVDASAGGIDDIDFVVWFVRAKSGV